MTDIVLVRHGETVWHADNRYAGRSDVALTARGHEQAEGVARWAAAADLDALWCSPLSRARETADVVARATGLAPAVDARLAELDFGRGEGLTTADMREQFPDALAAFHADPAAHHLPGGEDPRAAVDRALACLREIVRAHASGRVLVIAHTTLIRLALCHLIGVPIGNYRRLFPFVRNGAITEIRLDEGGASLMQFNAPLDGGAAPVGASAPAQIRAAPGSVAGTA